MFFVGFPKNRPKSNFDAERFESKTYDESTSSRRRPIVITDFRKGHKSKYAQLVRSLRRNQLIEANRQGFSVSRNPSIAEMIDYQSLGSPQQSYSSMTTGSNTSIPSMFGSNASDCSQSSDTISSVSSSSGLYILSKDPSISKSRNTMNDVHSLSISTTSLEQQIDIANSCNLEDNLQFVEPRTENDTSELQETFA